MTEQNFFKCVVGNLSRMLVSAQQRGDYVMTKEQCTAFRDIFINHSESIPKNLANFYRTVWSELTVKDFSDNQYYYKKEIGGQRYNEKLSQCQEQQFNIYLTSKM